MFLSFRRSLKYASETFVDRFLRVFTFQQFLSALFMVTW